MQKNVAGQKWIVFAFQDEGGANPGEPVTGDAANITANVRIDGGAANAVDDTNPTELEDGYYIFDITAAESNGDNILITPQSSTANVNVIGVPGSVWTLPAGFPDTGLISTTAAANLEAMYDGTGYVADSAPSSRDQVEGIAGASGGSLNFANEADNVDSAIKTIAFDGVETSGTNASVNFEAGTYHQIDDTANNIDIVYQFDVGGGRTAVEVEWKGRIVGTNDTLLFKAYNGSTWDTVKTRAGASNTAPTSPGDNFTETIPLLSTHTGIGADLGKVFIRLECSAQSNPTLYTDLLLVKAVNIGQSVGYADGRIWVDTVSGTAGTEAYVNGVADNPVNSWADALTLAAAVGFYRFNIASGSSITLTGDSSDYDLVGHTWSLAFGGQTITDAYISGATVSGTFAGTTAILEDCVINAVTGPGITMRRCFFNEVTITNNGTAAWALNDCRSRVAGTGAPNFDFGAVAGNTNVTMRNYMGGIEIENIGATGTDVMSLDGMGQIILNANCAGGTIAMRGIFSVTDNASGAVNLVRQDPTSNQIHQGTAQAGTANSITLAASASTTNGAYDPGTVQILTGPGAGETRGILGYNGTTKVAVVDKDWRTTPTTASSYVVYSSSSKGHVNEGMAQGGAATTITLNTAASATDDIYIGQTVFLVGGTGQDQSRIVIDYNGTTKVATVNRAWQTNPDSSSSYVMLPLPGNGDAVNDIKTKTDSLTFTKANELDANVQSINDVTITGDGSATPFDV